MIGNKIDMRSESSSDHIQRATVNKLKKKPSNKNKYFKGSIISW